ncbi:MAG TPA: VCBS repeat-containing protein [Candidatus Acidoferrales bacterium]|nr:VCBS repeat-containing protein [Candidatus Acidoferrales bacterium]
MKTTFLILALGITATWSVLAPRPSLSPFGDFDRIVIPVGKGPGPIAIADVNHDGHPDILVANSGDETLSVLLSDGHCHFTPAPGSPFPVGKGPNDIVVADMNADGNPDLIIANTGTPFITILLGDGRGGFTPAPHSPFATTVRPHVHGVAVGDFMGDGKPSVVTDSWGNDQILLIPSDGHGNLLLPGKFFHADIHTDSGVRAADFNHDGYLDLVTANQAFYSGHGATGIGLLLGDGKGGFHKAPGSPFPAGGEPWNFTIADINHDGNPDVVATPYQRTLRDPAQLGVTVLLGDGKGGFTTMPGSPLSLAGCQGPDKVRSGDLFADGLQDIVVSCAENNKLFLFRAMKDGSFRISTLDVQTGWSGLAVAALDSTGRDAIVVSNSVLDEEPAPAVGTITIFFSK